VEVREEVKMQQKPNKQKTRQGCRVVINGGARRKEMINMEVYEIKNSGACGSGGVWRPKEGVRGEKGADPIFLRDIKT